MSLRIGVVADNHRLVDPALPRLLAGVDEIWHAGDLVTDAILETLRAIAPVVVVRGNNDVGSAFRDWPEERLLERSGVRVLLRHIVGKPRKLDRDAATSIAIASPDIVIAGHSHQPLAVEHEGVVYLNPGSCGPRRFSLPRSVGELQISARAARFVVMDLDDESTLIDASFVLGNRPSRRR